MGASACGMKRTAGLPHQTEHEATGVAGFSQTEAARDSETSAVIKVHVATMGGQACAFMVDPASRLSDIQSLVCERWGHPPTAQRILLGETQLLDSRAKVQDLGVADGALLTLIISAEPLGQHLLQEPNGKTTAIDRRGIPTEALNEAQLQSYRAACDGDRAHEEIWENDDDHPWGNIGASGVDFYWTTRSDGCRYEYWSTDPGDNEYGILVRVDNASMKAIGVGSDDGLELFTDCKEEFQSTEVPNQLINEGWPRFQRDDGSDED